MIIVKIIGGLGNQMFQYAYAKALQQKNHKVKIDISAFEKYKIHGGYQLDKYNIELDISSKQENDKFYKNTILRKALRKIKIDFSKSIREKNLLFDSSLLEIADDNYISGYFQCEKYFKDIRDILLKQFTIKQKLSSYANDMKSEIENSQNSCSLHVRRGDFIDDKNIKIHGSCDIEYYQNSIKYLQEKISDLRYFIFSDDMDWAKSNLAIQNATYIQSKEKRIPHEDIYLMSLCDHNIIANSTFSWWGAWLNKNNNKMVITPKKWFADESMQKQSIDIVCDDWIKI